MADIVFYTNPQSRGRIVHWMLEELGEPYDIQWVEYGSQLKSPDYLAINPLGKVPALIHKGAVVTECAAICTYLAAVFPQRKLIPPAGDAALADFYRWMFFAAGPIEAAVTAQSMGWEVPDEMMRSVGFGNFAETIRTAATALNNGPYICGEQFTAVDVYFGSQILWGMMFGHIEKLPEFVSYGDRLKQRKGLQQADAINEDRLKTMDDSVS